MADGRRPAATLPVVAATAMADQRAAAEAGAGTGPDEAAESAPLGVRGGPDEGVQPLDGDRDELATTTDAVDATVAAAMAGLRATAETCTSGSGEAIDDAARPVHGDGGVPDGRGQLHPDPRRRQRSARRANAEMKARWLAAIEMDPEIGSAYFALLRDGRVEPATWELGWRGSTSVPDELRASGFNVQLEAERAVVAALARHELLGLAGVATHHATRVAEAAFQRVVERMAEEAFLRANSAAEAAGDRNPGRAAVVVVPWLLQNASAVRRAGTLAASRVLLLLRQDTLDDDHDGIGPGLVYEVLDTPGGVALFESVERESLPMPLPHPDEPGGEPFLEEVLWHCDIPAGSRVVGWPHGGRVWVHLRASIRRRGATPPSLHDHEDRSHGPYRAWPHLWAYHQPCAFVPLWYGGRQQLAVVRRSSAILFVDRDAEEPWNEEPGLADYDELYGDGPDGAYSFVGGAPDDVYDAGSAGSEGSEEDGGGGRTKPWRGRGAAFRSAAATAATTTSALAATVTLRVTAGAGGSEPIDNIHPRACRGARTEAPLFDLGPFGPSRSHIPMGGSVGGGAAREGGYESR